MKLSKQAIQLTLEKVTAITYRYKDASVPPRFHRSYTISITPLHVHVIINSYGTILKDETAPIKPQVYESLIQSINRAKLVSGTVKATGGCVGGTHKRLEIKEENVTVYVGDFDCCAGAGPNPEVHGDTRIVFMVIQAIFPKFQALLN